MHVDRHVLQPRLPLKPLVGAVDWYWLCPQSRQAVHVFGGYGLQSTGPGAKVEMLSKQVHGLAIPGGAEDILDDFAARAAFKMVSSRAAWELRACALPASQAARLTVRAPSRIVVGRARVQDLIVEDKYGPLLLLHRGGCTMHGRGARSVVDGVWFS